MSLLGTLEQFHLPNVLQRIEAHEKTGLLVVRQSAPWVEFYFRDGRLLCIGPVRTSATLADRLLQDKIISQPVWQEVTRILGNDERSETRVAITLMEQGYVTREELRAWTTEKSLAVLCAILAWTSGEVYFEESTPPPSDRLLVSMSIASLIETANVNLSFPRTQPIQKTPPPVNAVNFKVTQESPTFTPPTPLPASSTSIVIPPTSPLAFTTPRPKADITRVPTLMGAAQFLGETTGSSTDSLREALAVTESLGSFFNGNGDSEPNTNEISFASLASVDNLSVNLPSIAQPEIVKHPTPPKRIDTSFMQPDMILVPVDISAFREQNPKVQVTPDQWRILTCVDGRNSLKMACQLLGLSPDAMCALAGELVAEGLIYVVPPDRVQVPGPAYDLAGSDAPVSTATSGSSKSAAVAALPSADVVTNSYASRPFETESQWGNGGNGATFVPGRGWVTTFQPLQPLHSSGPLGAPSGVYAQVGSR